MVRSVTEQPEPDWSDDDRAMALALLAERAAVCPLCGNPKDVCRDPSTAGTWQVHDQICEPGRVLQKVAEGRQGERGLLLYATRSGG
jgi:hypothetical protein